VDALLDRLATRAGPARLASGAALLLGGLLLLGFLIVAGTSGVHPEAWGAAAALAVLVLSGVLYAWRLGAYGPPD
jgi:hypothetical protein